MNKNIKHASFGVVSDGIVDDTDAIQAAIDDASLCIEQKRFRWWLYNFAFKIFGRTKVWPKLGFAIWK